MYKLYRQGERIMVAPHTFAATPPPPNSQQIPVTPTPGQHCGSRKATTSVPIYETPGKGKRKDNPGKMDRRNPPLRTWLAVPSDPSGIGKLTAHNPPPQNNTLSRERIGGGEEKFRGRTAILNSLSTNTDPPPTRTYTEAALTTTTNTTILRAPPPKGNGKESAEAAIPAATALPNPPKIPTSTGARAVVLHAAPTNDRSGLKGKGKESAEAAVPPLRTPPTQKNPAAAAPPNPPQNPTSTRARGVLVLHPAPTKYKPGLRGKGKESAEAAVLPPLNQHTPYPQETCGGGTTPEPSENSDIDASTSSSLGCCPN
ncbi:hypothetical protein BGX38DRAFT_1146243 [Terfezia claveryi]|nr:hypothetical protein BGX38DRAFT_1146243 [Terfezia claveryi]